MVSVACGVKEPSAATSRPPATKTSEPYPATEDQVIVESQGSYVVYPTFAEIASNSDIIVVARIKSPLDIVNTARDIDDHARPDPDHFSIGQVYELEIDSYLKGTGPETIFYVENQGFISNQGTPNAEDIEREKSEAEGQAYIPLRADQTYLLFLRVLDQGYRIGSYDAESLYVGTGHPWQFDLADPNCVRVEDIIQEMALYFPVQPLTKIREQIEEPVEMQTLPYPCPEVNQECLITPYP